MFERDAVRSDDWRQPRWWPLMTERYLAWMRRRGNSEGTLRAYRWALQDFGRWIGPEVDDPEALRPHHVESWQDDLRERGLAPRTQQLGANSVRSGLKWGRRNGYHVAPEVPESIVVPKAPKLVARPLEPEHVDLITAFLSPARPKAPLLYWRTRALWFLMVTTGARVGEVVSLDRDDFEHDYALVRQKGGSEHRLLAPPIALTALHDYLIRREDDVDALFVTHHNPPTRRLEPAGVREAWHRLADDLGIPRFNTHRLRHTCASELIEAGVPVDVVAEHLGHHGLATVMNYARVSRRRRRGALDALEDRLLSPRTEAPELEVIRGRKIGRRGRSA